MSKLMRFPLVGADVTRHSLHGTYATTFWGVAAGQGPRYQQELRRRAEDSAWQAVDVGGEDVDSIAISWGPYVDFWSLSTHQDDSLLLVSALVLSRYLLLFEKHQVHLPLITPTGSGLNKLLHDGILRTCWKQDVDDDAFAVFMDHMTLDSLMGVLSSSITTLSTSSISSYKWNSCAYRNYGNIVGECRKIPIGPHAGHYVHAISTRHPGYGKYDPSHDYLLQVTNDIVEQKILVAREIAATCESTRLASELELVCTNLGLSTSLEKARSNFSRQDQARNQLTGLAASTKTFETRSKTVSKSIQQRNAIAPSAEGEKQSAARIQQAVDIIRAIREAQERQVAARSDLLFTCPSSLKAGTWLHFLFLVEYPTEGSILTRSAGAFAQNVGTLKEGRWSKRSSNALVYRPKDFLISLLKPGDTFRFRILRCLNCKSILPMRLDAKFRHTCTVLVSLHQTMSDDTAVDSRIEEYERKSRSGRQPYLLLPPERKYASSDIVVTNAKPKPYHAVSLFSDDPDLRSLLSQGVGGDKLKLHHCSASDFLSARLLKRLSDYKIVPKDIQATGSVYWSVSGSSHVNFSHFIQEQVTALISDTFSARKQTASPSLLADITAYMSQAKVKEVTAAHHGDQNSSALQLPTEKKAYYCAIAGCTAKATRKRDLKGRHAAASHPGKKYPEPIFK